MKRIFGFWLGCAALSFSACNNEIDVAGDYKDMPVVYCLLNKNDAAHYIRVQKAFLVNGNVLHTAQIPDSLKYDPADLEVKIIALDAASGNPIPNVSPILFQYQPGMVQDTGAFAKEGVMIYKSTANLNDLRRYRLEITNTKLNKMITSETGLVYGFAFKTPPNTNPNFKITFNPISHTGLTLRWTPATNGFVYQPEITFRWTEVDLATNASTADSVVWNLLPKRLTSDVLPTEMDYLLPQNSFYEYVGQQVSVKSGVKRVIGTVTIRYYVGTEELNTYIEVNQPSIGIIQNKPVYTNITNGLGLFAGRTEFTSVNYGLSDPAIDTLMNGKSTSALGFRRN